MVAAAKRLERCPTCGRKNRRSNPQNALYWLLLHEVSEKVQPQGKSYNPEVWHTYFRSRFLGCDDVAMPNGITLAIPHSTAALDVAEFGDYFDRVQAWGAEHNVYLDSLETT